MLEEQNKPKVDSSKFSYSSIEKKSSLLLNITDSVNHNLAEVLASISQTKLDILRVLHTIGLPLGNVELKNNFFTERTYLVIGIALFELKSQGLLWPTDKHCLFETWRDCATYKGLWNLTDLARSYFNGEDII